jgi:hypothetical protein
MHSVGNTLTGTPWWVYALFFYLMFIGFRASQTRVVSLKKLCILPLILTYFSLHTLITVVKVDFYSVITLLIAGLVGVAIGWHYVNRFKIKVDKQKYLFEIPGTWSTLIVILLIFVTKYYFGYEMAVNPALVNHAGFEFALLSVSGVFTGWFVGKLVAYLYKLRTGVSVELNEIF